MGLSRTYRFRDRRRFQSKVAKFSHPVYFAPPLTEFPLESGIGEGVKKTEWCGYQVVQNVLSQV